VEAWPLGVDPKQKPLYALKVDDVDSKTVHGALVMTLRGRDRRAALRPLYAVARVLDSARYTNHALCRTGCPGQRGRGRGVDVRVGGTGAAKGNDYERRSETGDHAPVVCGRQQVCDAGGDTRSSSQDFHQPELSVGARDGIDRGSDCARRPGSCARADAGAFAYRVRETLALPSRDREGAVVNHYGFRGWLDGGTRPLIRK
jgi:hypothetical protein